MGITLVFALFFDSPDIASTQQTCLNDRLTDLARVPQHGRRPTERGEVRVPPIRALILQRKLRGQRRQVHGVIAHPDDACFGGLRGRGAEEKEEGRQQQHEAEHGG